MHDGRDVMPAHHLTQQPGITAIAHKQWRARRNRMRNSRRKIIDDNDLLAGVNQRVSDMAADVSRATCYEDCHRSVLKL
jgi:hypothetical protein